MAASYPATDMAVKAAMLVLGFMTGTSLDAVDMAVLDTDGGASSAVASLLRACGFGEVSEVVELPDGAVPVSSRPRLRLLASA